MGCLLFTDKLKKPIWLLGAKIRFLFTPKEKRVRIEIYQDGRHLTYLLVSLHSLGYAVHVVESPMVFRELLAMKNTFSIPFICGGKRRDCGLSISDQKDIAEKEEGEGLRVIHLDKFFFSPVKEAFRMPYFMHPSIYHSGLHGMYESDVESNRPVRIGFFGTRDADFYVRNFHFPILNREEILKVFFAEFTAEISTAQLPVEKWTSSPLIVSVDEVGGDHGNKSFLPQGEYIKALRACDFILSPPGWCMPLSHNLIEAMAAGAIPVINSADYFYPKLEHGVNCLSFSTGAELKTVINRALAMPTKDIQKMRRNVLRYYEEYLVPSRWLEKAIIQREKRILVNAEELSLNLANTR